MNYNKITTKGEFILSRVYLSYIVLCVTMCVFLSTRESFLRIITHQRYQHEDGLKRYNKAIRCKIAIGIVEVVLEHNSLERCLKLISIESDCGNTTEAKPESILDNNKPTHFNRFLVPDEVTTNVVELRHIPSTTFALIDATLNFEGLRLKLYNGNQQHVFTLTGKEFYCRYSRSISYSITRNRSQFECRLG